MGLRCEDILPAHLPADEEQAHIAGLDQDMAAAALGDPDLAPALSALDAELGTLGLALDDAASTLAAAARDIARARAAIRILTRDHPGDHP